MSAAAVLGAAAATALALALIFAAFAPPVGAETAAKAPCARPPCAVVIF